MNNIQLYEKLKGYIQKEKEDVSNGVTEQWIYDKLLIKLDEFMEEIENESPVESIQRIINKYIPTIEAEKKAEQKLSEVTNYKINKENKMTKEEFEKWLLDSTEERIELETNTYFDEEKFVKDFGTSKGIILPLTGDIAKEFLENSRVDCVDEMAMNKCKELSKNIIKKY